MTFDQTIDVVAFLAATTAGGTRRTIALSQLQDRFPNIEQGDLSQLVADLITSGRVSAYPTRRGTGVLLRYNHPSKETTS